MSEIKELQNNIGRFTKKKIMQDFSKIAGKIRKYAFKQFIEFCKELKKEGFKRFISAALDAAAEHLLK